MPLITSKGQYLFTAVPFPCFTWSTIRDRLDAAEISWRYYTPSLGNTSAIWNSFDAISGVRYGAEWNTNISTPKRRSSRILRGTGLRPCRGSSHNLKTGPLRRPVVRTAVGRIDCQRNREKRCVEFDRHRHPVGRLGGLYDHVAPPQLSYDSLGFRVPLIIVSPYARKGYVSRTQYEFGSVLKFIEENWGLASLGKTDVRANSMRDLFDFEAAPRAFETIPSHYSPSYFIRQKRSNQPVDTE